MATKVATNGKATAKNRVAGALKKTTKAKEAAEGVVIRPLRQKVIRVRIVGLSPYCQNKFSEKAKLKMMATQKAGSQAKSKKEREPRNYELDCEGATYRLPDGSPGIPASCFRNACISACKLVGFHMTRAKLSLFVDAEGLDTQDATPLVRIKGKSEMWVAPARNANGSCDLRSRPLWRDWSCELNIRFDEDQFSVSDIANLLIRAGAQVGIGEGRPDSRQSNGMGFGQFTVELPK